MVSGKEERKRTFIVGKQIGQKDMRMLPCWAPLAETAAFICLKINSASLNQTWPAIEIMPQQNTSIRNFYVTI